MFYSCPEKVHKIHRKTPATESLSNKVAGLRLETLISDSSTCVFLLILRNFQEHVEDQKTATVMNKYHLKDSNKETTTITPAGNYMFKVNHKVTRTTPMRSFWCL